MRFHTQFPNRGKHINKIVLRNYWALVNSLKNNSLVSNFCFLYSFLERITFSPLTRLSCFRWIKISGSLTSNLDRNWAFKHLWMEATSQMGLHKSVFCISFSAVTHRQRTCLQLLVLVQSSANGNTPCWEKVSCEVIALTCTLEFPWYALSELAV